ncbi:MAG: hypothetical protein M3437_06290 [Chloroflexota bacterium]|nr:hypothetical protein [Chloroflexota bacterium]MDQ5866062.1 hypothetical protein [Chloroflexota bacterium]
MIAKKLTTLVAVAALLTVLAACDGQTASPTPTGVSNTGTATPQPNVTVAPGTLLTYNMSGGIAGFNTTLVLEESGDYTVTERGGQPTSGKLEDTLLNKVKQQLDAVRGLSDLKAEYDEGNVSDDIYRTITFERNGTPVTVMVADVGSGDDVPAPLQQLIATVRSVAETP